MKNKQIAILVMTLCAFACKKEKQTFEASGTFEATEIVVSSEAAGQIMEFRLNEGDQLQKGQLLGYIDTVLPDLKRRQLHAQVKAILGRSPDIPAQLAALQEQENHAVNEKHRVEALMKDNAATQKQLDDINSQIAVLQKQIKASRSTLGISSNGISLETDPLRIQILQLNEQIEKCRIVNPVEGTVLQKYAQEQELAVPGKPLYKIADLRVLSLRAYITGDQLPGFRIGEKVKVYTDADDQNYTAHQGVVEWISSKAEFTPKTIQTKDERANLVYAMKVRVINNGSLKIGMYAEISH